MSVEFWSRNFSCSLENYPRGMDWGPTVNVVSDSLIGCFGFYCDIFQHGFWHSNWKHTNESRQQHSSVNGVSTHGSILLLGGVDVKSTEWIAVGDAPPPLGPLTIRHGAAHCTIKHSDDYLVVTGGSGTENLVTEYRLNIDQTVPSTPLGQARINHACGVYYNSSGPVSKWQTNKQSKAISLYLDRVFNGPALKF